ncbi:MAG: hypothetical protein IT451_02015 [Candidatus Brocadia sp.]|nr:hypothetical protein [Candidatus Brocadia sp.]
MQIFFNTPLPLSRGEFEKPPLKRRMNMKSPLLGGDSGVGINLDVNVKEFLMQN